MDSITITNTKFRLCCNGRCFEVYILGNDKQAEEVKKHLMAMVRAARVVQSLAQIKELAEILEQSPELESCT